MRRLLYWGVVILSVVWMGAVGAQTTEGGDAANTGTTFKEDAVATVECVYNGDENFRKLEVPYLPTKGTYHYNVYVPPGYNQDVTKQYPCLFVSSPGGNAGFSNVQEKLRSLGWLGIGLVEAKNGPYEPIMGNFLAAHDDAVKRFRIQEGMKVATGFSGGARASSMYIGLRDWFEIGGAQPVIPLPTQR